MKIAQVFASVVLIATTHGVFAQSSRPAALSMDELGAFSQRVFEKPVTSVAAAPRGGRTAAMPASNPEKTSRLRRDRPPRGAAATSSQTPAQLPVREVTVFKDGHAFVAHEGEVNVGPNDEVVLDYLPAPVLGTFWPYVADSGARIAGVVAGKRRTIVEKSPLTLRELLEASIGAEGTVTETGGLKYPATIVSIPRRSMEELDRTDPRGADPRLSEKGSLILLRTFEGTKAVPIDRIQDFTFKDRPGAGVQAEEFRNVLTLRLGAENGGVNGAARIGLGYLQKGLRWIPNYRLAIDGAGKATVTLQATLINELTDLENVNVHLVVGVPAFAFKDTLDPISLQQVVAQLARGFQPSAGMPHLSNAIMAQTQVVAPMMERVQPGRADNPVDLGPDVAAGAKNEDLYVFSAKGVTLRKGDRMLLPVAEYAVEYKDVFTLDVPFSPPAELRGNLGTDQQAEMARLLFAPKVMHKIRLANSTSAPFTTAPALVVRDGRVLGQGMMTYAAPGGSADVEVTTSVDIHVKRRDREVNRVPNAVQWQDQQYAKVELAGTISLTSFRNATTTVEVTRSVLGEIDSAGSGGAVEKASTLEDAGAVRITDWPQWWGWYNWPYWWSRFNGIGRVQWTVQLEEGKRVDLDYNWHYFWQ